MIWINKEITQLAHNYLTKTDSGDQHARPITQNARRQAEFTGDRVSQRNDSRIDNRVTALRSRINTRLRKEAWYLLYSSKPGWRSDLSGQNQPTSPSQAHWLLFRKVQVGIANIHVFNRMRRD